MKNRLQEKTGAMPEEMDHASLLAVETILSSQTPAATALERFPVPWPLHHELTAFFGHVVLDVAVFIGDIPRTWGALAYCKGRTIVLDRSLPAHGPEAVRSTLAHEFAHAWQQQQSWHSTNEAISIVDDRVLESEAQKTADCFLTGRGLPNLTLIHQDAYNNRQILQCQHFGSVGAQTLEQPRTWAAPAALHPPLVNVTYGAHNCRNEVWIGRDTAFTRAKTLAGITREARRTYHFTNGVINFNQGAQIAASANPPVPAAGEGRYYDYGPGPRGRLMIVEHINDVNASFTLAGDPNPNRANVPHFHICTYGQHGRYAPPIPAAAGRNWQVFDQATVYMPYFSTIGVQGFRTAHVPPRQYEQDGRFGEMGDGENKHHIYYI